MNLKRHLRCVVMCQSGVYVSYQSPSLAFLWFSQQQWSTQNIKFGTYWCNEDETNHPLAVCRPHASFFSTRQFRFGFCRNTQHIIPLCAHVYGAQIWGQIRSRCLQHLTLLAKCVVAAAAVVVRLKSRVRKRKSVCAQWKKTKITTQFIYYAFESIRKFATTVRLMEAFFSAFVSFQCWNTILGFFLSFRFSRRYSLFTFPFFRSFEVKNFLSVFFGVFIWKMSRLFVFKMVRFGWMATIKWMYQSNSMMKKNQNHVKLMIFFYEKKDGISSHKWIILIFMKSRPFQAIPVNSFSTKEMAESEISDFPNTEMLFVIVLAWGV